MSSTGILLMFVFVLILHISLSKYSASVEQAEQAGAVLAEVDARKELQAEVQAAQYRLQSLLAGEVAQFEELVSRRTKKYSEVPPVVTETETEDPPKPLLSDLDMEFYRNTAPVENPAVLMLRGGVWSSGQRNPKITAAQSNSG
ncbi:MAG: hypothetical protein ACLFVC_04970 [Opitutales bacterium]